jgi:iron uptake system EfeUOB component EfeO/EfeM
MVAAGATGGSALGATPVAARDPGGRIARPARGTIAAAPDPGGHVSHPVSGTRAVALSPGRRISPPVRGERITFGNVTCAPHWQAPNPGLDHFALVNQSSHRATIYLFHADSGTIVGQITSSRPGTVRGLSVRLSPGSYTWGCDLDGLPRHVSDAARVSVHGQLGGSGPPVVPVQTDELAAPIQAYRTYVAGRLRTLQAQIAAVVSSLAVRDRGGAESAWLTAHLTWLQIGQDDGAYGAFGELGRAIDGTAAGLDGGTSSPEFTGFHKLELDLWLRDDLTAAATDAARLASLIDALAHRKLASELPTSQAGLVNWTLRSHEILEDALRDSLSGDDDYGSGTDLASVTADVAATREMLSLLAPLIVPRSPYLVGTAERQLMTLFETAETTRADSRWVAVSALTLPQRERVDGAAGAALETLAPVPDLLRIGNT